MSFNWWIASYAHRAWLGPWAVFLDERHPVSVRSLRRVSSALIDHHDLARRYLKNADRCAWLMLPQERLVPIAHTLGVAMLGGWVRNSIERRQVAAQLRVLSVEQRAVALYRAATLNALPFSRNGVGWPLTSIDPSGVVELGLACMAALLVDHGSGCKERFLMRFAPGRLQKLALDDAQREEANTLICAEAQDAQPETAHDAARIGHRSSVAEGKE